MVADRTQPPSVAGNGGTSVPPPANEIRSGARARIRGRVIDIFFHQSLSRSARVRRRTLGAPLIAVPGHRGRREAQTVGGGGRKLIADRAAARPAHGSTGRPRWPPKVP